MSQKQPRRLPKMGRHSSGQARVTLAGKVYYLGPYGSVEAQRAYADLLARWQAGGGKPLDPPAAAPQVRRVRDLLADYLAYLDGSGRYHKGGKPTSQRKVCKLALDEFAESCGSMMATALSDAVVRRHRDLLEQRAHLSRGGINRKIDHVRKALRWARERGMLTREQWFGILEIRPLSRHECGNREFKRDKRAVTVEEADRVAEFAPVEVSRMLRVQARTGMRPAEVVRMRWCDLSSEPVDVDGIPCVVYTVQHAKNEHHGKGATTYALPPAVMAILGKPTGPGLPVFPSPKRSGPYDPHAYRNAIAQACDRAGVPHFSPHEVRHGFLTRAARRFGVLAASAAANHADTRTTAGYLHQDRTDGYRCVVGLIDVG